ncbi:MAG: FAD-dependent oxidoreductase [Chloroflexota bacterium]
MAADTRFDFVVVGAGAAGCVIAARLAAAGSSSVLLVEAGPDLRDDLPEARHARWGRGQTRAPS